jgi:putative ATPase
MDDLFGKVASGKDTAASKGKTPANAPLADRMRPGRIEGFFGQEHLIGEHGFLKSVLEGKALPSLILWGPPGSGKTTLANIIAAAADAEFMSFSAVLSGVKDVREVIEKAKELKKTGRKTLLFVDEIHRFNKAQQDAFLHHVEDGTLTLIGATTENPSFEVIAPLLSRCRVLVLKPLEAGDIKKALLRALSDKERGLGWAGATIADDALDFIVEAAHGDARYALNALETALAFAVKDEKSGAPLITLEVAQTALQKKALLYDKDGEEHYNVISAFIKSMRGSDPDAALYWLARMIAAGEEPLFIARRMVIFASEDISNADPRALTVALAVKDSVDFVGMPEGWIPLAQGVAYLATAPKSNASYMAYKYAEKDVKERGPLAVPLHIRNAPTKLMQEFGYAKDYKYPHDFEGGVVDEVYMPDEIKHSRYYKPTGRGYEKIILELMEKAGKKRG